jgi:pimeloyl-ACP methyl ester carboxylesterase
MKSVGHRLLSAIVGLALLAVPLAAQQPASRTYVVAHGAWGGGWDWRAVDSLLTSAGHRVYRPTLTGLGERAHLASPQIGLDTHTRDIVNVILWENLRDVILIGHSYGGMVATAVADSIPDRIAHMIYLDAMVPDSGESALMIMGASLEALVRNNARDGMIPAVWSTAEQPLPKDVAQPLRTFTDTLHVSRAKLARVRSTYILTAQQGREPDGFQPFADRAKARGWTVHRMEADHVPNRSKPLELVRLLLEIVRTGR